MPYKIPNRTVGRLKVNPKAATSANKQSAVQDFIALKAAGSAQFRLNNFAVADCVTDARIINK
jgi:hypothetical protein